MNARIAAVIVALIPALLPARAQAEESGGFGGLGSAAPGFEIPRPGAPIVFPQDHGPHAAFRTEWWYLTANLHGPDGASYGVQWTLFRHALSPGKAEGWDDRTVWMAHAAATRASDHFFAQSLARGGVGQAGVEASPFKAYIDDWSFDAQDDAFTRGRVRARSPLFSYDLALTREAPFVLQGENGFSRKSDSGQASHYYSQPFFLVSGTLSFGARGIAVSGKAWMDREWSSQPLAADQKGWDWFSLHLASGEKLMLFRLRGAHDYVSGNWIAADGTPNLLGAEDISLEPLARTTIGEKSLPTRWRVRVKSRGFEIETIPLNARSWMGAALAYWEGPISFAGSHTGEGYLEMTGY